MSSKCIKEAEKAVRRARAKEGPTLIECKTYRWRGHHEGDPNQGGRYRTKEEIEAWKEKDPIKRLAQKLTAEKILLKKRLTALEQEINEEIDRAVDFASKSAFPAVEALYEDVYVQEGEKQ